MSLHSKPEEHSKTLAHVRQYFRRCRTSELHASRVPVQILHVVRQDHACDSALAW